MKPMRCVATEKKKVLKAVHKQLKAEETRMYAAKSEEASESSQQQQCILSGGVYLRHRFEKADGFEGYVCVSTFSPVRVYPNRTRRARLAFRRARNCPNHFSQDVRFWRKMSALSLEILVLIR
jgi:hypothetical protein